SGVGHCLVQLAKADGLRTVNIVRREGPADELLALGADVVLLDGPDLAQRIAAATAGARIRLAIDAVGGSQIVRFGDALTDEAVVLNYGRLSGENPQLSGHQCVFKRLMLTGFWLVPWLQKLSRQEVVALYAGLARRMAEGTLRIAVEKTFRLDEIKEAVARANAYRRSGKGLVTPNGPVPCGGLSGFLRSISVGSACVLCCAMILPGRAGAMSIQVRGLSLICWTAICIAGLVASAAAQPAPAANKPDVTLGSRPETVVWGYFST